MNINFIYLAIAVIIVSYYIAKQNNDAVQQNNVGLILNDKLDYPKGTLHESFEDDLKEEIEKFEDAAAAAAAAAADGDDEDDDEDDDDDVDDDNESFESLTVGSEFECLEEEAICKIVNGLGTGGFGSVYKVQINFKKKGEEADRRLLSRDKFLRDAINIARESSSASIVTEERESIFVALKVFNYKDKADANKISKNFDKAFKLTLIEAMTLVELPNHPNIIDIYHVEMLKGTVFIYEAFIEGDSLTGLLKKDRKKLANSGSIGPFAVAPATAPARKLTTQGLLSITYQLALGMEFIHSLSVHHFDMKSDNIMIEDGYNENPIVKIVDFGMSQGVKTGFSPRNKPMRTPSGGTSYYNSPMYKEYIKTKTGDFCYISPSSFATKTNPCCSAHDNWALGLIYIFLWTGREEFANFVPKSASYMTQHNISHNYSNPEELLVLVNKHKTASDYPEIPLELVNFIFPLLANDHKNRTCTLSPLINYLKSILSKPDPSVPSSALVNASDNDESMLLKHREFSSRRNLFLGEAIIHSSNNIQDFSQRKGLHEAAEFTLMVGLDNIDRPSESSFVSLNGLYLDNRIYLKSNVHCAIPLLNDKDVAEKMEANNRTCTDSNEIMFYRIYYNLFEVYNSFIRDDIIRDVHQIISNSSDKSLQVSSFDFSNYSIHKDTFRIMVKAVKVYRNSLVYDLKIRDSKDMYNHIDFLSSLNYLAKSPLLTESEGKDILEAFTSPLRSRFSAGNISKVSSISTEFDQKNITDYLRSLLDSVSLDIESPEISLKTYLMIIPGSNVMLVDASSSNFFCLSGKQIGTVASITSKGMYKVIGPSMKTCTIDFSSLRLSRQIRINSRVVLSNPLKQACGLSDGEFGVLLKHRKIDDEVLVRSEVSKKDARCKLTDIMEV